MPSNELLLNENEILNKLYDPDCMMAIELSVARGYIALLGGLDHENADLSLSFMSLTQGNVIDACFGVVDASIRRRETTPATRSATAAKQLLDECAANSDDFPKLAVAAYCNGMEEIVAHQTKMKKLNCITKCFKSNTIRKQTEKQLRVAFVELAKAVGEAS